MLLSRRSGNDTYAFFTKLDFTDKASLLMYRREFLEHTKNGLHGDFDRGYFSAWSDCMRVLSRLEVQGASAPGNDSSEEKSLETLKSDKSQVTMANFFRGKEK
jgi:hypothetical protein